MRGANDRRGNQSEMKGVRSEMKRAREREQVCVCVGLHLRQCRDARQSTTSITHIHTQYKRQLTLNMQICHPHATMLPQDNLRASRVSVKMPDNTVSITQVLTHHNTM